MTMPTNVEEKIAVLNPEQRKKVEKRAAELSADEMSLRELRRAPKTRAGSYERNDVDDSG